MQGWFLITNIKPEKQACCEVDAGYTLRVAVIHLYRLSKTRVRAWKLLKTIVLCDFPYQWNSLAGGGGGDEKDA